MTNSSQGFRRDTRGNVAILVALTLMVLVSIVLVTLDYAKAYAVRYSLQAALDAAALAAANEVIDQTASAATTESRLAVVAQKVLVANLNIGPSAATVTPVVVKYTPPVGFTVPDKIELSASATINTTFLKTLGVKPMKVVVSSSTQPPQGAPIDLALVLDITYSMTFPPTSGGEAKITTLKAAATALVNQVTSGNSPNVQVGVVPYNTYVNVGLRNPVPDWVFPVDRTLSWCSKSVYQYPNGVCKPKVYYDCLQDGVMVKNGCSTQDCSDRGALICTETSTATWGWSGCIGTRTVITNNLLNQGANQTSEAFLDKISTPTIPPKYSGLSSINTACNWPQILGLTNDKSSILSRIAALTPAGDTFIPAGLIWGWNILAPGEPYAARTLAELDKIGGFKAMVLMTDGVNSTSPRLYDGLVQPNGTGSIPTKWRDGSESNKLIGTICQNIKNDGIRIYTVLFDVQDAATRKILQDCSSDAVTMSFNASNRDELLKAFADIGNQLRLLKLTQ